MYPSNKHDEWFECKNNWGKKSTPSSTSTLDLNPLTNNQRLGLIFDLKAVMVVNFQCAQEEEDKLWSDAVQNSVLNQTVRIIRRNISEGLEYIFILSYCISNSSDPKLTVAF